MPGLLLTNRAGRCPPLARGDVAAVGLKFSLHARALSNPVCLGQAPPTSDSLHGGDARTPLAERDLAALMSGVYDGGRVHRIMKYISRRMTKAIPGPSA